MTRSLSLVAFLLLSTVAVGPLAGQSPGLTIELPSFELFPDSNIAHGFAQVRNLTATDITDFTVVVRMGGPQSVFLGGEGCVNGDTPYELFCSRPLIRAGETLPLQLYIGPIDETRVFLRASVSWNGPVAPEARRTVSFPRDFIVTNTGDEGPGSLRAAIEQVNLECTGRFPCRVAFRIEQPIPESGWYTIYPNTPLPAVTAADIEIDGATQTRFGGDTNPLGPEILLSGAALWPSNGLILDGPGYASVSNLAIGGFSGDGIAVLRPGATDSRITNNYIGTDASGTGALANGRGITFTKPASGFEVSHNLISNNVRSGVFITGGYRLTLSENTIRGNSAGIFIGPDTQDVRVVRNSIVENTQFGVAIAPATTAYNLVDNSITRNGFIGVDRGLDGFSGYELDPRDGGGIINGFGVIPPRLSSARYDPVTNTTTIEGTYFDARVQYSLWELTLYRSSVNDGQGEAVIGHTTAQNGRFSMTVPGDLRGQSITALGQLTVIIEIGPFYWTSEFSESIQVQ